MAKSAKIAVFIMNENQRLKLLIQTLGISQAEFARKLGVSRSLISEYLSGRKRIPDKTLRLISHTFGVSYEWLKYGKGEMWEKGGEEVPVWLREFMKKASDKDVRIVQALIEMLEEVPEEEKDLLFMMLKKLAGSSRKK